jgi:hypothetical protein
MIKFRIEGMRNGEWTTLFSPLTRNEARQRYAELCKANPACRYRIHWFGVGEPVIEAR